jgi:hypothetical protein
MEKVLSLPVAITENYAGENNEAIKYQWLLSHLTITADIFKKLNLRKTHAKNYDRT